MKRFLYAVSGVGLVSIVVIGILYARSPLRGTWSVSPFVPSATAPGMPAPIPTAAAGTLEGGQRAQHVASTDDSRGRDGGFVETFHNPPEVRSAGGVLSLTLTAELQDVEIAGQRVQARVYNGLYIPPTLRVHPGDTMQITLVNAIDQPTNLHHHGSNVSPLNNGDNVFIDLMPGQIFNQRIVFPPDHLPGLLWYHPHRHMFVESQIFGGMSGGLIVEGMLEPFPHLQGVQERIMLLKDFQNSGGQIPTDNIDSNAGTTRTVNGVVNPTLTIRPGETQFWRIANIGADIYYRLQLDGHILYEIARDGNRQTRVVAREEILLPPAARTEVLVQGGPRGIYSLRTLYFDQGADGDQYPEVILATLISAGRPEAPLPLPTPAQFPPVEDLRAQPIATRRTVVFSENPDTNEFFIDGKLFDEQRIDTTVQLGTVEEWTIENVANEEHVFHIHQLDFQVTEVNGQPREFIGHQDVVNLPVQSTVKILIPFTNPVIVGKFVYHCHIVGHEDNGMMAVIEVVDPQAGGAPQVSPSAGQTGASPHRH
jgi:suppressor of ftsI